MIEKFNKINNFATYKNFNWDTSVLSNDGSIYTFKKLNIIYGRNYSGKTSLSKILRSFEKNELPKNYQAPEFSIALKDTTILTNEDIANHNLDICIYNKDFVIDNLKFIITEDGEIAPFAIMGKKNIELEKKINEITTELGSIEKKQGLLLEQATYANNFNAKKIEVDRENDSLKELLRNKARSIKENATLYKNVNYRINNIESDIEYIMTNKIEILNDNEIERLHKIINELNKNEIKNVQYSYPELSVLESKIKKLIEYDVSPSKAIKDFIDNPELQSWSKQGIELHKSKRTICGFCFQNLPRNLWEIYNDHFNKESDELVKKLNNSKDELLNTINEIKRQEFLDKELFFGAYHDDLRIIEKSWEKINTFYVEFIKKLIDQIERKENNIFEHCDFISINDTPEISIENLNKSITKIIENHNKKKITLAQEKADAIEALRYNEVNNYINDIQYYKVLEKIEGKEKEKIKLKNSLDTVNDLVGKKQLQIQSLKNQMKDERLAAEKINEYLGNYFGNNSLKIEYIDHDDNLTFQIKRGTEQAYNLSEGECSLISFCYFLAKLDDVGFENKNLIIWIDDPISSLDNNHVFFVYSLIESRIAKPKKYEQLFISTHNIDFLKYIKKLTFPMTSFTTRKGRTQSEPDVSYFLIERVANESRIISMPKYLKKYTTEFNYLFHQIQICSEMETMDSNYESFYNFGNNLRKFLEAYLFYKYPNNTNIIVKLRKFCKDDDSATALINRVDNELSHLEEIFDRSIRPIDIPEIPKLAKFVLKKIKEHDEDQYSALLKSIKGK